MCQIRALVPQMFPVLALPICSACIATTPRWWKSVDQANDQRHAWYCGCHDSGSCAHRPHALAVHWFCVLTLAGPAAAQLRVRTVTEVMAETLVRVERRKSADRMLARWRQRWRTGASRHFVDSVAPLRYSPSV